MSAPSRLALLPGYDTSPDIYETTPSDLTTSPPTRPTSASSATSTSSSDNGISHRRILPNTARERFAREGRGLDVRVGDFGDGVGRQRKGWRFGRIRREDEGLEERMARLRREVEECRVLAEKDTQQKDGEQGRVAEVDGLKRLLEGVEARTVTTNAGGPSSEAKDADIDGEKARVGTSSEAESTSIADFDARLSALERMLGPLGVESGTANGDTSTTEPLLPSLRTLDQQLSALMTATSLNSLDAASERIRKLREETEALSAAYNPPNTTAPTNGTSAPQTSASPNLEKLQTLYTLLPTLQTLSPTVPALLERLRSLHTLHTGSANAAAELEALERQQDDLDAELKAWREGLERVEEAVTEAGEGNLKNAKVVQGWVKGLEDRMDELE